MRRAGDAAALLARAIRRDAAAAGCAVTLEATGSTPWASATFVGARHAWRIDARDADVGPWLARLADTDLSVPGHVLADLAVTRHAGAVTIEALTLEAA